MDAQRGGEHQIHRTGGPGLWRARNGIESRFAPTSSEPTNQLRKPMQIDGLAQFERSTQNLGRHFREAVPRGAGGNDGVVVRPDGTVVVRLRVVPSFAGRHGTHTPAVE
jgi:hypothetical protein